MVLSLGTNGVRAKFSDLNPKTAMDFAFAFSLFTKKNFKAKKKRYTIAVARDMRLTSPCISEAVFAGLMEGGSDVLDLGLIPSPVAEWALKEYEADGLIIVTASHNPAEYNALKFVDSNAVAISRERGAELSHFLGKEHTPVLSWEKIGKITKMDTVLEDYKNSVIRFTDTTKITKRLKVIIDPGNGTSTLILPKLLDELGAEVLTINSDLDGTFPNRPSEPSEKNLEKLIFAVKEKEADFGVGLDGDADRITFVDEKGRWIVGDKCVAICNKWALQNHQNLNSKIVLTTSATSKVVESVANEFGAKTIYTDVGAPYLAEQFLKHKKDAICGGEEVGGIVFADFTIAKDGILSACKLLEIVSDKPLSECLDELPVYYNAKTKVNASAELKSSVISEVMHEVQSEVKDANFIKLIGGFRINFDDSWVLVRASGTEDYIRIFAEAKDKESATELMYKYKNLVQVKLTK